MIVHYVHEVSLHGLQEHSLVHKLPLSLNLSHTRMHAYVHRHTGTFSRAYSHTDACTHTSTLAQMFFIYLCVYFTRTHVKSHAPASRAQANTHAGINHVLLRAVCHGHSASRPFSPLTCRVGCRTWFSFSADLGRCFWEEVRFSCGRMHARKQIACTCACKRQESRSTHVRCCCSLQYTCTNCCTAVFCSMP